MKVLVTGAAGFIGYHLTHRLCGRGDEVVGIDNINDYYDLRIKYGRLGELGISETDASSGRSVKSSTHDNFRFTRMDLQDKEGIARLFASEKFDRVCNLAAQAGVRYSLTNPDIYISTNIQGFLNLLEAARAHPVEHLVYASSSSVYGINKHMPFSESGAADHPASLYAASKRADELIAHTYAHLFDIPTTGLRFFTVYGPWGRPDMALFLFTKAILEGRPIDVFNNGAMKRDFTYVDDIVEGVVRVLDQPPTEHEEWDEASNSSSPARYRLFNIGNGAPIELMDFITAIERELGIEAKKNMMPIQPGDVPATWADCTALEAAVGYRPNTNVWDGIRKFVAWYREFYSI